MLKECWFPFSFMTCNTSIAEAPSMNTKRNNALDRRDSDASGCPVNRPVLQKVLDDSDSSLESKDKTKEFFGDSSDNICDCTCCEVVEQEKSTLKEMMTFGEEDDESVRGEQKEEKKTSDYGHYFLPLNVTRKWNQRSDTAVNSGTIPRPQLMEAGNEEFYFWKRNSPKGTESKQRLTQPPSAWGTFDRTRNIDANHYASVDTMKRGMARTKDVPRTPADVFRNYLDRMNLNLDDRDDDPMDIYSRKMSAYFYKTSRKNSETCHLEGLVAAIGFVGIVLSIATFLAYLAVQAPHLRRTIGPFYATEYYARLSPVDNGTEYEMRRLEPPTPNVIYGVELGCSMFAALMTILTNSFLIHGVRNKSAAFLIPWLVFHSFVIFALGVSAILILSYVMPAAFKALSLVPIVATILILLCWLKVFKLYSVTKRSLQRRSYHHPTLRTVGMPHYMPREPKIPKPDYIP